MFWILLIKIKLLRSGPWIQDIKIRGITLYLESWAVFPKGWHFLDAKMLIGIPIVKPYRALAEPAQLNPFLLHPTVQHMESKKQSLYNQYIGTNYVHKYICKVWGWGGNKSFKQFCSEQGYFDIKYWKSLLRASENILLNF